MKFNKATYDQYVADGYLKAIPDPEGSPLTIYDYTFRATVDQKWDEITLTARGLILDDEGNVVCRPFRKFFNLNERPDTRIENLPAEVPELAEKLDGSMVAVWFDPFKKRWRATTRGCWDNEQTRVASAWISDQLTNARMAGSRYWDDYLDFTYIFELVAPWNRIVVAYEREEMVLTGLNRPDGVEATNDLLGEVAIRNGWRCAQWARRPVTDVDLADSSVRNTEGFVARFSNGLRLKLKYDQYVSLHKVVSGLSVRGIWESLSAGGDGLNEDGLPDELLTWYRIERNRLVSSFLLNEAQTLERWMRRKIGASRKDLALDWQAEPPAVKAALFAKLDGKPYDQIIWKALKPDVQRRFSKTAE